jgi:hypothetical protein
MTEQGEGREEGAEREQHGHQEGLEPDPLAERLTPDGAVMLVGILGRGPTDEDWYLFLNREMTRRAEFKASDVLHSEKIREEDPPFLGAQATRVYLRRGARVVYTTTRSREVQAEFLRGDIGTALTAEAVPAGLPGAEEIPQITFSPWGCGSAIDACPSVWGGVCRTIDPLLCPPQSRFGPCISTRFFCDSRIDACPSALGCASIICPR